MRFEVNIAPQADRLSAAFEHSITWEDDIWRADPVDVEAIHAPARRKFTELLDAVTTERGASVQARILLFHGQSGAGKTHLIRALRTSAHRAGKAYFGYAQMTPDVANYADYYLRRLVNSLEKPYDPDDGRRERACPPHQPSGRRQGRARCRPRSRSCATPSSTTPSSPRWCWRSPTRSSPRPSSPARASTSISCARCSICSAPIRASTSACASISTAAS